MFDASSIFLAGFPIREISKQLLTEHILARMNAAQKSVLFFANTNFVVQCRPLLTQMQNDAVIIVNDGVGMDIAALLFHQRKFKENLNGTDFTPFFFSKARQPLRVFLVGGQHAVIAKASVHLSQELGQIIAGTCDGYDGIKNNQLVELINQARADVVLVAMGNPKQEQWILDNYLKLNANLVSGVGALFDFWAGDKPRAPVIVQKMRMEWFYRLCIEPKRLFKRYTIDILVFLFCCFKYRANKGAS